MEPDLPAPDEGIPAADAGAGAPPPSPGFGIAGEDPDRAAGPDRAEAPERATEQVRLPEETPFRTPDPRELRPDGS